MAIEILELHHHAVRCGQSQTDADRTVAFYRDVLGLGTDDERPDIPTVPGYWVDVGGRAQIHIMGADRIRQLPMLHLGSLTFRKLARNLTA